MKSLSATTSSSWSTPLYCLLFLISLPILIQYTSGHAANHVYADQNLINEVEPPLITLNITGQRLSGSFDVDFREEALVGLDIYDAFRPINFSSTFVEISHLVNDQRLARSILPTDLSNDAVLPLEIRATTAGTFTITAAIDNLPDGWTVIFKDTENSTTIALNDGTTTSIVLPEFVAKRVQSASGGKNTGGGELPSTSAADRFSITISPGVPPTSEDTNLFGIRDQPLVLAASEIPFTDTDTNDTLSTLLITESPANGDLIRDSNNNDNVDAGETINPPDTINSAELDAGKLKWLPLVGQSGFQVDSLRFRVGDGASFSNEHVAFLSLDTDTVNIGSQNSTDGWRFLTNPFDSNVSDFLAPIWTQGFPGGADISGGSPNIFSYQESAQAFSALSGIENSLPAASGLAVFMFTDDDALTGATQGGWPKTLTATGTPQTDTVRATLSNTDADQSGDLSNDEGWNMIGNPYGTAISVDSVLADLEDVFTGVNQGVYIWDPEANSGDGSYVNLQANNNERIAPFQAFFIRILDVDQQADVVFSNAIRTRESVAFRKQVAKSSVPVRIIVEQDGIQSALEINFREQAAAGIDVYDGFHLSSLSTQPHVDSFFRVDGQRLTRSVLPRTIDNQVRLPLFIQSNKTGAYTLRAHIGMLPNNTRIELHNVETGEIFPLTDGSEVKADKYLGVSEPKGNSKRQTIQLPAIAAQGDQTGDLVYNIVIHQNTATDIVDQPTEIPDKVTLDQNYPNPFNPSTTIAFALPRASQVSLNVYTLTGRRVATLIQGQRSAGSHTVVFNAQNVSSGVYVYRLEAEEFAITRKMILIK